MMCCLSRLAPRCYRVRFKPVGASGNKHISAFAALKVVGGMYEIYTQ